MNLKVLRPQILITHFFEKNLFERIIVYIFCSHFLVKLIFEFILGEWSFVQSQNQQWIFYGFLGLDYLFSYRKILNIKITINPMSILAFVFLIMIFHGLLVGIVSKNPPFIILNDTVPILMIFLNILRMQSFEEISEPINIRFLFLFCIVITFISSGISFLAVLGGKPSDTAVIASPIYFPLLFAGFFLLNRPIPKIYVLMGIITLLLAIPEMNRTTLTFVLIVLAVYSIIKIVSSPAKGVFILLIIVIFGSLFWALVPEDSRTYQRISNIGEIDLSRRTGSIGERQAEWDAIKLKLNASGETIDFLGLGFGGTYDVKFTHQYLTEYGHAHYSWAWFNLRYGKLGYLYLIIFLFCLFYNSFRCFSIFNATDLFLSLLCLMGILYCATHVNSVFLQSGIHFLYYKKNGRDSLNNSDEK